MKLTEKQAFGSSGISDVAAKKDAFQFSIENRENIPLHASRSHEREIFLKG